MSAFYTMQYVGVSGIGMGALYIGRNKVVGADVAGGRYVGSYTQQGARLIGSVILSMPMGGALVTGQQVSPGSQIPIAFDWPVNFANGQNQTVNVMGNAVQVVLDKVGDIP